MKILNLYSCLGGNRYKWGNNHQITAIELDENLCLMYKARFPNDKVIRTDAHEYLLKNYKNFDFIWSSPPCHSHSKSRFARKETTIPIYPDLKLYEEILFLKNYFKGKFVVENVVSYYEPLIPAKKIGRHLYWSNFFIPNFKPRLLNIENFKISDLEKFHEVNISNYKGNQRKDKILRNLVDFYDGKIILEAAEDIIYKNFPAQISIFDDKKIF